MTEELKKYLEENELYVGKYQGDDFIIIESWEQEEELEKLGCKIDIGFSGEYSTCASCCNIIHTLDGTEFQIVNGEMLCAECIKLDSEEYILSLINNEDKTNMILSTEELGELGFELMQGGYEHGFYGITDKPREILDEFIENNNDMEFIFHCDSLNPFAIYFSLYGRETKSE